MDKLGTVLIVDDDNVTLHVLSAILSEEGFLVETFADGEEAKERISSGANGHAVGLAIVDLHMSCINGIAFSHWIKQYSPHVGVIFITAQTPAPIIPGHRVVGKPVSNKREFADMVWGALKAAATTAGFRRIENKVDTLVESQTCFQGKMEETIIAMSGTMVTIGATATEAKAKATEAVAKAEATKKELDDATLSAFAGKEWDKAPKGMKWALGTAGTIITGLITISAVLGAWYLAEMKGKADDLFKDKKKYDAIADRVETKVEPALLRVESAQRSIDTKLEELLQRPANPSTPNSPPPPPRRRITP